MPTFWNSKLSGAGGALFNAGFIAAVVLAASSAGAQQNPIPPVKPPVGFDEGVDVRLTREQVSSLIPWSFRAKAELSEVLEQLNREVPTQQFVSLDTGIRRIVESSNTSRATLLMRYVLNRGLLIHEEVARQSPVGETWVLDQRIRVLRRSAELAVKYADSDAAFLNDAKATLPYADFGLEYSRFLSELGQSVVDASAQFRLVRLTLEFLAWDLYQDERRLQFAPSISKLQATLEQLPEEVRGEDRDLVQNVREMKRAIRKASAPLEDLFADIEEKTTNDPASLKIKSIFARAKFIPTTSGRRAMQSTEVTQLQWVSVMHENLSFFQRPIYCPKNHRVIGTVALCPNHPVDSVSWASIQIFLERLNEAFADVYVFSLPTGAEWEFAANSGNMGKNANFDPPGDEALQYAYFAQNSDYQTHEVGELKPNAMGFYDILGNVWELTSDRVPHDPVYLLSRGGARDMEHVSSDQRSFTHEKVGGGTSGFRLMRWTRSK